MLHCIKPTHTPLHCAHPLSNIPDAAAANHLASPAHHVAGCSAPHCPTLRQPHPTILQHQKHPPPLCRLPTRPSRRPQVLHAPLHAVPHHTTGATRNACSSSSLTQPPGCCSSRQAARCCSLPMAPTWIPKGPLPPGSLSPCSQHRAGCHTCLTNRKPCFLAWTGTRQCLPLRLTTTQTSTGWLMHWGLPRGPLWAI